MESIYSAFSLDRKELHKLIMMFKRHVAKKFDASICKIRVMPGGVEFSTAGIYLCLNCETVGLYEILVPLKLLFAYTSHGTQPLMSFTFREGEMTCGNSIYSSPLIKLKNWRTTSGDSLKMNYSDLDIMKLAFTEGETFLEERNMKGTYKLILEKLDEEVYSAFIILEKYGLSRMDIRNLVFEKITHKGG